MDCADRRWAGGHPECQGSQDTAGVLKDQQLADNLVTGFPGVFFLRFEGLSIIFLTQKIKAVLNNI